MTHSTNNAQSPPAYEMTAPAPRSRRDLDLIPIRHQDRPYVLVNDDLGLAGEGTLLPWALYEFMAHLDGKNSLRDIQFMMMRQRCGVLVGMDELERLLAQLDTSYLLETDRYRSARAKMVAEFSASPFRPCTHCGRTYPAESHELRRFLDGILSSKAPGARPEEPFVSHAHRSRSQAGPTPQFSPPPAGGDRGEGEQRSSAPAVGRILGLVAPHIDLKAGAGVYGSAFRQLRGAGPKTIILLGVGHKMTGSLFSLTEKDFETPLGLARADRPLVTELRRAGKDCISEDDFAHRSEHSLEFQVIFLQHLMAEKDFSIVPILCGSLSPALPAYNRKAYTEKTGPFLDALSEMMARSRGETVLVAGVDLSHIGPKFGHEVPASHLEGRTRTHDRNLLRALAMRDADAYWEEAARERDQYNVCGFSALACLLEVLPPADGDVLDYHMWHEDATSSAVSFAAVVFRSPG